MFRILGRLNRGDQGQSLEEILDRVGLSRTLPNQFRKATRERWTKQGQQDMIRGTAWSGLDAFREALIETGLVPENPLPIVETLQ